MYCCSSIIELIGLGSGSSIGESESMVEYSILYQYTSSVYCFKISNIDLVLAVVCLLKIDKAGTRSVQLHL